MRATTFGISVFAVVALLFLFTSSSVAVLPNYLNVQGRLTNINDDPKLGEFTFVFRIYNAQTGGTPLWSETKKLNTTNAGYFSTLLGSITPLNLTFNQQYYLEVTADGETMLPRYTIASSAYSFSSNNTQALPASISNNLTIIESLDVVRYINVSAGSFYVNAANSRVGIGTSSPAATLDVRGDLNVSGLVNTSTIISVNSFSTTYNASNIVTTTTLSAKNASIRNDASANSSSIYIYDSAGVCKVRQYWNGTHFIITGC